MTGPIPQSPRRRRRWSSPSLRVLMLLILVVGVFLGWKARRANLQRRAVAAILAAGGTVVYDSQLAGFPYLPYQDVGGSVMLPPARPWGPAWMRRAIGDDYFQEVVGVRLNRAFFPDGSDPGAIDDMMGHLEALDRLELLQVQDSRLTDAGLAHLRRLTRLRGIRIDGNKITDAGLATLRGMANLEELIIIGNPSRIGSLASLAGLTRLRVLFLLNVDVDDGDLAHLSRLSRLESLHLLNTRLTDAGLAHLAKLGSLQRLSLDGSPRLTDAGLAHLAKLTNLESIHLFRTGVTDAGLAHLAGLTRLDSLDLSDSRKVTGVGASRLTGLPLKFLDLSGCAVDAAGLEQLARQPRLQELRVMGNPGVIDAGLMHLRHMDALLSLDLRNTGTTVGGAVALQGQIPSLRVQVDGRDDPLPPRPPKE